jgi:hypothetical protein
MRLIRNSLILTLALGVLWAVLAGAHGYTLGNPPGPLEATASCYHTMRVDFVVPMYKPAPAIDCQAASPGTTPSGDVQSTGASGSADGGQCAACTTPAPAPAICDDPNWRTDGNLSGEKPC